MFSILDTVGLCIQAFGILMPLAGFIIGILSASQNPMSFIIYSIVGFVVGALLYGFGGILRVLVCMEENSRRTNELLAMWMNRQQIAPTHKPLRELGRNEYSRQPRA